MAVRLRRWPVLREGGAPLRSAAQRKKMAAVAAEPGAAAVPTTTATDEGPPAQGPAGPGLPGARSECEGPQETGPALDLGAMRAEDGGDAEGRHVRPELEPAAGNAHPESDEASGSGPPERVNADRFSPGLPADPEGGGDVSAQEAYRGPDPQPSAVFLHSFPAAPPVTEAGLSLAEPAEPTTNETTDRAETAGRGYTSLEQAERRPATDTVLDGTADGPDPDPAGPEELAARGPRNSSPPCRSPKRRLLTEPAAEDRVVADSVLDLSLGSEVRVCLDHVIDDALVVSFRLGEKVFSGVLMDVSKR